MFTKNLGRLMSVFISIAYTEGSQPRIARMTRMKNMEALASTRVSLPIRVIRVIRG